MPDALDFLIRLFVGAAVLVAVLWAFVKALNLARSISPAARTLGVAVACAAVVMALLWIVRSAPRAPSAPAQVDAPTTGAAPVPAPTLPADPVPPPPPPVPPPPVAVPPSVPAATTGQNPNTVSVRVFFGTDRKPLRPREAVFADEPTADPGELALGWCTVSVPWRRHVLGQVERPTYWTFHVSDWFENPDRHFVITQRPLVEPSAFWQGVKDAVGNSNQKEALLFIHGYNVSFDDAVYRTAQIATDLQFRGASLLYSWPSNAVTLRYVADKDHSLSTLGAFKTFLIDLSRRSGASTIHVIAHSMGNNALLHALAELDAEQQQAAPHFRQIIMAAPDVDRREFLRLATGFQRSADRISIYAASNDRALGASEFLQGAPRVGDANPMFLHKGIDSIDASMIIKGFLKHGYFADPRVLDDIGKLLTNNAPLPRFGLMGMPNDQRADYWRFRR